MKLADFINVSQSEDAPLVAQTLFRRKYGRDLPEFPYHVVASYRTMSGEESTPVCYVHFTDCGDILLGGGACVDNRALRHMDAPLRDAIREAGGIYQYTLRWSVTHFAPRFAAVFGYCGDALAERIDRAVGFESTTHDHLLVFWTRDVDARRQRQMIAKAQAFAPF